MGVCLTALSFYLHRANIKRIINKEELKISAVIKKK
jgi:glycerol-3-phosphate acyltransferase PlsY